MLGCTPFDPFVDTETVKVAVNGSHGSIVAPPSIRLWILKPENAGGNHNEQLRCTPFDPFVDTETLGYKHKIIIIILLHPLRSVCGY